MSNSKCRAKSAAALLLWLLGIAALSGCARNSDPAAVLTEARGLLLQGKSSEARIALKNLAEKQPGLLEARVLLAQIALDQGDVRTADLELSRIDSKRLTDPASQLVRQRVKLAMGKGSDVLAALDSGAVKLPASDAAVLRAAALRTLGRGGESIEGLRAAVAADPGNSQLLLELATTLAASGNLRQALQELDTFLAVGKPNADVLKLRGELRLRSGQTAKALEDFTAALAAAPPTWPGIARVGTELLIGEAHLAAGDIPATKALIAKVDKQTPGILGTRLLGARVALAEKHPAEAADTLQRIAEAMPDNVQVQYLLIDALLRSGNAARATSVLQRRVKQQPDDAMARRMLAQIMLRQNRPDDVLHLLGDQPDSAGPKDSETDGLLSVAKLAKERAGQAISVLTTQLAAKPADPSLRAQLAAAYLLNGEPGRSLGVLQEAKWSQAPAEAVGVELAAQLALGNEREANQLVKSLVDSTTVGLDVLLAAIDSAQRAGNNEISGRLLDRALARDPHNEGALLRSASLAFSQQRYPESRAALDLLLKFHPDQAYAGIAQARVAEAEGNVAAARAALQSAVQKAPAALEPALMLAGLELRTERLPQAIAVIDALTAAAPKDGVAANAAGMLLLNAKRNDEARTRFRQAAEQKADVADYWFNLGRSQLALGDRAAARDSFVASVERRPDWFEANSAAIRLNAELGSKAEARQLAEALTARAPRNPAAWLLAGDVAAADRRFPDAAAAYSRSYTAQASAIAASRESMVRLVAGIARPDEPLLTWLGRNANDLDARRQLSDYYLRTGAMAAAAAELEKIVAAAPNDIGSLNNLAWALTKTDSKRAEQFARRANAIDPKSPPVADTLGWLLAQTKRYAEARPFLELAAKGMAKDGSVQYHLAVAQAGSDDKAAARQTLAGLLASDTKFAERAAAQQLAQELGK